MALNVDRMHKPVRKLRKLLKKMPKRPTPDEVHDFRTNSRRIEATVGALSLDKARNEKRLLKRLARLRKRAGKVRDMDVFTSYAKSVAQPDNNEDECAVQLLEHLGAERQKQTKKFRRELNQYGPQLRRLLKRIAAEFERALPHDGRLGRNGTSASVDVAAVALKLTAELAQPAHLTWTNLHEYRLKVKELRNVLQMADDANRQEFVDKLGEVKDAIGEWHDWEELASIAKDALDHGARCHLIRQLRKTSDAKYQAALALARGMRSKYLGLSDRSGQRSSGRTAMRPADPVWSVTATLAA